MRKVVPAWLEEAHIMDTSVFSVEAYLGTCRYVPYVRSVPQVGLISKCFPPGCRLNYVLGAHLVDAHSNVLGDANRP